MLKCSNCIIDHYHVNILLIFLDLVGRSNRSSVLLSVSCQALIKLNALLRRQMAVNKRRFHVH